LRLKTPMLKKRKSLKTKNKLLWQDPVIARVKLSPEQAVLACCSVGSKIQVNDPLGSMCWAAKCGGVDSISATNT
jgi:hypothetical protein